MLKKVMAFSLLMLVVASVSVQAESVTIQGPSKFYDGTIGYFDSGAAYKDDTSTTSWVRDYYSSTTTYDVFSFYKIDLSDIPAGATIDGASFSMKMTSANDYQGTSAGVNLWYASHAFTTGITPTTYDGVNSWGSLDGINDYYQTPASRLFFGQPDVDSNIGKYITFPNLKDYVNSQMSLPAGQRYAYLFATTTFYDGSSNAFFGTSEAAAGSQPYLLVNYTVPEPVTLVLLGIGAVMGVIRRRK